MKGIYKLLVVGLFAMIWTLPACGYDWLIREYCSEVNECKPEEFNYLYQTEDNCFNLIKAEVDSHQECETSFENFYECDMNMLCHGSHKGVTNCDKYERKVISCAGFSPYEDTGR